jgi:hypothetical protein
MSNDRLLWMCYRALVIKGKNDEAVLMLSESQNNDHIYALIERYVDTYLRG